MHPSIHPRRVPSNCLNSWAFFITALDPPLILRGGRGKWGEYVKVGGPGVGGSQQEGGLVWLLPCLAEHSQSQEKRTHTINSRLSQYCKSLIIVTLMQQKVKIEQCLTKKILLRFYGRISLPTFLSVFERPVK